MIIDQIAHAENYYYMGERIASALRWLKTNDATTMDAGTYPIRGQQIYAMVQTYQPADRGQRQWEAHRRYLDVQYMAAGTEHFGYCHLNKLEVAHAYDAESDVVMLNGDGDFLLSTPGTFLILAPHDAHMPGVAPPGTPDTGQVTKVVIKVAVG